MNHPPPRHLPPRQGVTAGALFAVMGSATIAHFVFEVPLGDLAEMMIACVLLGGALSARHARRRSNRRRRPPGA